MSAKREPFAVTKTLRLQRNAGEGARGPSEEGDHGPTDQNIDQGQFDSDGQLAHHLEGRYNARVPQS